LSCHGWICVPGSSAGEASLCSIQQTPLQPPPVSSQQHQASQNGTHTRCQPLTACALRALNRNHPDRQLRRLACWAAFASAPSDAPVTADSSTSDSSAAKSMNAFDVSFASSPSRAVTTFTSGGAAPPASTAPLRPSCSTRACPGRPIPQALNCVTRTCVM
jgi:hypothetical protein